MAILDNVVVASINREDGPKIIQWLKSKGVDTFHNIGIYFKSDGYSNYFYGIIDGKHGVFTKYTVIRKGDTILSVDQMETWGMANQKIWVF